MFAQLLKGKKDAVFSLITLLLSSGLAIVAFSYPAESSRFPRVLCLVIIGLSIILLYKSVRQKMPEDCGEANHSLFNKTAVEFYVLCFIYILSIIYIGFFISSYFFVIATCIFLRYRNKYVILIWPAVLCLILWIVFSKFLNVPTPTGILF